MLPPAKGDWPLHLHEAIPGIWTWNILCAPCFARRRHARKPSQDVLDSTVCIHWIFTSKEETIETQHGNWQTVILLMSEKRCGKAFASSCSFPRDADLLPTNICNVKIRSAYITLASILFRALARRYFWPGEFHGCLLPIEFAFGSIHIKITSRRSEGQNWMDLQMPYWVVLCRYTVCPDVGRLLQVLQGIFPLRRTISAVLIHSAQDWSGGESVSKWLQRIQSAVVWMDLMRYLFYLDNAWQGNGIISERP